MRNTAFLLFFLTFSTLMAQLTPTKTLTPELLWSLGRVNLEAVSPNQDLTVYHVQRFDIATDKNDRILYAVENSTGKTTALSPAGKSATDAEFRPGTQKIGFLLDGLLHEVNTDGSGLVKISDIEMNGFHYAPDGKKILYAADVKLDKTTAEQYPDLPNAKARIIDGLLYRHWKSWGNQQYSNVFYAQLNGDHLEQPLNIQNERFNSPLKPMGGMEQITWSRDSRFIVYTCRKLHGTEEARSTNSDIYVYELASKKTMNVSEGLLGYDMDPAFSPDGNFLVWTSQATPGYEADRTRIMLLDLHTNQRRELTDAWDFEANHPQWSADSKTVYFLSSTDFTYQLYSLGIADKKITPLTSGQMDFTDFKVMGNQIIASRVAMDAPAEIYAVDTKNGNVRRITSVNTALWDSIKKAAVVRKTVKTTDGKDMNAWVILPPDFDPARKYPAVMVCQGGPQSAMSQGFSYRWNYQLMASNGYVVIAPCRRGMPGSGQEWNRAISGDFGGQAMQDLLSAADYIGAQPYVDKAKIAAVGASYGGYSVFWLAGNHQKRFKTFISHCGMFNFESFYGTTEEVWFPEHDFDGPYWQNPLPETWKKDSPHLYVQNWDTPILVIHNELDFRVPISEGMQAFQAAQLRGIPSKFLVFPDEGHWMTKPQNSLLWQREFFGWLDKYLK